MPGSGRIDSAGSVWRMPLRQASFALAFPAGRGWLSGVSTLRIAGDAFRLAGMHSVA